MADVAKRFVPLLDRILVQKLKAEVKTASGIFLPESAASPPNWGKVLAIGPGKLTKEGEVLRIPSMQRLARKSKTAPKELRIPRVPQASKGGSRLRARAVNGKAQDSDSDEDESKLDPRKLAVKKWVKRLNWVWRKLSAAFWVGMSCLVIYYTNFFRVIWESPLVNRTYFYLALACLGFNMTMLAYLAIWCSVIKGMEEPWENNKAIPVMALVGFSTAVLFFFAFWPVWGFLTLVIQWCDGQGAKNAGKVCGHNL